MIYVDEESGCVRLLFLLLGILLRRAFMRHLGHLLFFHRTLLLLAFLLKSLLFCRNNFPLLRSLFLLLWSQFLFWDLLLFRLYWLSEIIHFRVLLLLLLLLLLVNYLQVHRVSLRRVVVLISVCFLPFLSFCELLYVLWINELLRLSALLLFDGLWLHDFGVLSLLKEL